MVAVMAFVTHQQIIFIAAHITPFTTIAKPFALIQWIDFNAEFVVYFTAVDASNHLNAQKEAVFVVKRKNLKNN